MLNQIIRIGKYGPIAPHIRVTKRWPIAGIIESFAWKFDGQKLVIRRVSNGARARLYAERMARLAC